MSQGLLFVCGNYSETQAAKHAKKILTAAGSGQFVGGVHGGYFKLLFPNKAAALATQAQAQSQGYQVMNWNEWVFMNATTTFSQMSKNMGRATAESWVKKVYPKLAQQVIQAATNVIKDVAAHKPAEAFYLKQLEKHSERRAARLTANKFEVPIEDVEYAAKFWTGVVA